MNGEQAPMIYPGEGKKGEPKAGDYVLAAEQTVVRLKNIERTKRKIGIAAARKAMILKIIVHCQCRVTLAFSFDHLVGGEGVLLRRPSAPAS